MGDIHKEVNLKDNSISYNRNPELLMNIGLQLEPNFLREQFEKFKNNNNFYNYNICFYFNQFHTVAFNPPLFHNGYLLYFMPIFGVGEIILIKKNWFVKIFDDGYQYVEYENNSEKEKNTLFDFFIISDSCTREIDKTKIKSEFIDGVFIPNMWIERIGAITGEIYTLCNNLDDNCIEVNMKEYKKNNIFAKRKDALSNPKIYNLHLTSFTF